MWNRPFYKCLLRDLVFEWQLEAGGDLVCYKPHDVCCVNQVVLMLTTCSWYLNEKSLKVGIKARSHPALLAFIGQVTAHHYKIAYCYKKIYRNTSYMYVLTDFS